MTESPEGPQELEETRMLLDQVALEQRRVLDLAREQLAPEDLELVAETLEREARADEPRSGRSFSPGSKSLWVLAAASAAAVVLLVFDPFGGSSLDPLDQGPSGTLLNQGVLEILSPRGTGQGFAVVEWKYPTQQVTFHVLVADVVDRDRVLVNREVTQRTRLVLDPGELSDWPDRISVTIRVLKRDGTELDRARATASR